MLKTTGKKLAALAMLAALCGLLPAQAETIRVGKAVPEAFSLGRAYTLFVTLGLRHLPVVDAANRVKAIVTRKDLLGFRLDDAADRALGGEGGTSPARRGGGTWGSGVSLAMMEPHMSGF